MVVMDGRTKFHEIWACMMTSSNGNILRVTGPLCGEFTGPGEFPAQRPVTRSFDVYFDLRLNKRLSKQSWGWWFETLSRSLWRHRNVMRFRWISYMATAPWVRFLPIDEQGSHQRRYIQCGAAITRSIFSKIITKYPIARLSGRGMGCLLCHLYSGSVTAVMCAIYWTALLRYSTVCNILSYWLRPRSAIDAKYPSQCHYISVEILHFTTIVIWHKTSQFVIHIFNEEYISYWEQWRSGANTNCWLLYGSFYLFAISCE